ncbi:MAG: SHOCT domain-containing protein [Candidatus Nanopelagicales bacterium]|jgi:hypothetical protein
MGLMRMAARTAVVAGTATAVSGRVAHKQDEKYADQAAQQQAAAAPAAPADDDPTEKIKQLADLHAQGILSDEEFAAAKKKALGI